MKQVTTAATERSARVWMTTRQAAEYCGVDPATLWRARKAGKLRAGGAGRAVRYHRDDLDAWLRSGGEDVTRPESVEEVARVDR
jgi:excisionase family DNA binding protein